MQETLSCGSYVGHYNDSANISYQQILQVLIKIFHIQFLLDWLSPGDSLKYARGSTVDCIEYLS